MKLNVYLTKEKAKEFSCELKISLRLHKPTFSKGNFAVLGLEYRGEKIDIKDSNEDCN